MRTTTLGQACNLKAGKFVSANDIADEYADGLYPCFGGNGVRGYVKEFSHEGTFPLIGRQGALCGNVNLASGKFRATEHAVVVQPNVEMNIRWLYYQLLAMDLGQYATGAAQPGLAVATLEKLLLTIPPMDAQEKIAAALDKVSDLIALRKQQLAKLDELVKSRFVEMFELHSWPQHKAGIFMDDMRNGVSPSNTGTYKAHVLTLSAITQGTFDRNAWKEGGFDCIPSEDKRVSACDFYMCRGNGNRNLVGSGVYSKENLYGLVFPDTVIAARVDTNMVRLPFLCEAWKRPAIRSQIEAGARTTNGTFKINQKVIANIDISIPPIGLQDSFVAFVEQTDKSKLEIQTALTKLETLKKALMQQYFE